MDYYERSLNLLTGPQVTQPSLSDAFWERVEALISDHFAAVPDIARQQQLAALRIAWQDLENNRFTPAGKKLLTSDDSQRFLDEFAGRAKTLQAKLQHHLGRVPEDVRPGLREFYLKTLLSSFNTMCQIRTVLVVPGEDEQSPRLDIAAMIKGSSLFSVALPAGHLTLWDFAIVGAPSGFLRSAVLPTGVPVSSRHLPTANSRPHLRS